MKQFRMKSGLGLLVAGALIAVVAGPSRAEDPTTPGTPPTTQTKPKKEKAPKAKLTRTSGKVVSVNGTTIVIKLSKKMGGTEKTFTVPDTAKVVKGKEDIKLDSITVGERVTVAAKEDGTVTRVTVAKAKATPVVAPPATQGDQKK